MNKYDHTRDSSTPFDAPQLLLASIDKRWDIYNSELECCRNKFSNEAIRTLRIATRRMLAFVQLLRMLNPRPRLQKLHRTFKDQLDSFDNLRDTQVMLAEISETIQEIPTLQSFQEYLQKREECLLRSAIKKCKQIKPSDTAKRILKTRETLENMTIENIPVRMLQAVDDAFLITQQRLDWVNPSDSATIHSVRLSFKKFRYLVEIIHPSLENFPQGNLQRMKDYQRAMGKIQDTKILLLTLADFSSSASTFDPEPALRFYEQRHTDASSAYIDNMREVNTFWRAAPGQPFPWENIK
jgi:CHAD domain-containing protein